MKMEGKGKHINAMDEPLLNAASPARPPDLAARAWRELRLLWRVVGPAVVVRMVMSGVVNVATLSAAGHLGDRDLAAMSLAVTVIHGFNFGIFLGMSTALETLCGQAYGARRRASLGVYLQRAWIVLFLAAVLLSPMYVFSDRLLVLLGQPPALAADVRRVTLLLLPLHFAVALQLPVTRFFQSQMKNYVTAAAAAVAAAVHLLLTWLAVFVLGLGAGGAAAVLSFSWCFYFGLQLAYVVGGGCPETWKGFSPEAFAELKAFVKLAAASGVMLCLEYWYYRVLILITGYLPNAETVLDALAICMSINGWQVTIPLGFLAGTGVRVSNELGAGNGRGAMFSTAVSVSCSFAIGLVFWALIILLHDKVALIFTSSTVVIAAVDKLAVLLAFTILLNSVQPVLSGVAVGAGWQSIVAYVNVGTYYFVGVPLGVLLGWSFHMGVEGIWTGMICGTAIQTIILAYFTSKCDWNREAIKASIHGTRT